MPDARLDQIDSAKYEDYSNDCKFDFLALREVFDPSQFEPVVKSYAGKTQKAH